MKKFLSVLTLFLYLFCTCGCGSQEQKFNFDLPPAVRINGKIYLCIGEETKAPENPDFTGFIKSCVNIDKLPSEDDQANFQIVGQPYAMCGDTMMVYYENNWHICIESSDN